MFYTEHANTLYKPMGEKHWVCVTVFLRKLLSASLSNYLQTRKVSVQKL